MDKTTTLVSEFHEALGLGIPQQAAIPGLDDPAAVGYLGCYAAKMRVMARNLKEICEVLGHKQETALFRSQVMVEELAEVMEAMAEGDLEHTLHELADLRYTVDGTAVTLGVSEVFEEAVEEVHRANMSKLVDGKPIYTEAGRIVKGPDFKAASMTNIIKKVLH